MAIKKHIHVVIALSLFLGILGIGQLLGLWQLKNHEIGGDTLIVEVANKYGIPLGTIYEVWDIPEHVSPLAELSEARDKAGFSIGRFRIWVTAYVEKNEVLPVEALTGLEHSSYTEDELNLRASTTIQLMSDNLGIPLEEIYRKFSLPGSLSPDTTLKELRENYEVELGEIKIWLKIKNN